MAETLPGGLPVTVASERLFGAVSTQRTPQGAIFTAKLPTFVPKAGRKVVLDGVQDAGNVGTVIRTAAALGIAEVILAGDCADPFGHKAVRASMGGVFRIPVRRCAYGELRAAANGLPILTAEPRADARDIRSIDGDFLPVIGSEGQGVSDAVAALADGAFTIPMSGSTESLNAAVAAAIVIWEISGRR